MRLDKDFFASILRPPDKVGVDDMHGDFDTYLVEQNVVPLLMQGLDALARHVDRLNTGLVFGGGIEKVFNPLVWLAQFLLRNHPRYVKDQRTPMYQQFSDMAAAHRGRRALIHRKEDFQAQWELVEKESKGVTADDLPGLARRLDTLWGVNGAFTRNMPTNYKTLHLSALGEKTIVFYDYWKWFENYTANNDTIREESFHEAERRRKEEEEEIQAKKEEELRLQKKQEEAQIHRRRFEESFDNLIADMYINDDITAILNKGAFIQGVEEREGGPPLIGDHIEMIIKMLQLWGCPLGEAKGGRDTDTPPEDYWGDAALAVWSKWSRANGLLAGDAVPRVDAASLRHLMNKEAFQKHLEVAYPTDEVEPDPELTNLACLRGMTETKSGYVVEAVDEETQRVMQFHVTDAQVATIKQRLQGTGAERVLAMVDRVSATVADILPPPPSSQA